MCCSGSSSPESVAQNSSEFVVAEALQESWASKAGVRENPRVQLLGDSPTRPPYALSGHNEPVLLHEGRGTLTQNGSVACGPVTVSLTWLPSPNVTFELDGEALMLVPGDSAILSLLDVAGAPDAEVSLAHLSSGHCRGTFRGPFSFGEETVTSMVFLVPNMPTMYGDVISSGGQRWAGRVDLPDPPWRIRLESRPDISAIVTELKMGGYAPTHVGRIDRTDGASFATADARAILEGLGQFLSFSRGFWTTPLLLVGYEDDVPVWHEWCARHASPWRTMSAWFSPHHADSLSAAFPLFMDRWRDLGWRDTLVLGIGWFVEANQLSNAESSIVLGQVALELLAWAELVEEHEIMSRGHFKAGPTEQNIRELLRWADIPLAIPAQRGFLSDLAAQEAWEDGPAALIGYRNLLTHPRHRVDRILNAPVLARTELGQLALWYVELVLLRFLNYEGDYVNRLTARAVGEVEAVPWRD